MSRMWPPVIVLLVCAAAGSSPALAQTSGASLETVRRQLAAGDSISLKRDGGGPVTGRLVRLGQSDLDIRPAEPAGGGGPRVLTIPLASIQSLERRRDPIRNGTLIGAGIGAGLFGTMFGIAVAIDRNDMDEWAPQYLAGGAVMVGVGALVGALVDSVRSKPVLRFDRDSGAAARFRVGPLLSRGRGIAVTVSF